MSSNCGDVDAVDTTDADRGVEPSNSITEANTDEEEEAADVSESVPTTSFTRTRTWTIVPPNRFM